MPATGYTGCGRKKRTSTKTAIYRNFTPYLLRNSPQLFSRFTSTNLTKITKSSELNSFEILMSMMILTRPFLDMIFSSKGHKRIESG